MLSPSLVHADTQASRIPGKGLLGAMRSTHRTRWLFPSSAQRGSESVWSQPCQTTSGEAQSSVSKTKETQSWWSDKLSCPQAINGGPGGDVVLLDLVYCVLLCISEVKWEVLHPRSSGLAMVPLHVWCKASSVPSLPPSCSQVAD